MKKRVNFYNYEDGKMYSFKSGTKWSYVALGGHWDEGTEINPFTRKPWTTETEAEKKLIRFQYRPEAWHNVGF